MPRKRAGRKSRTADRISLEKQLETAERRKRNLELKEAKFGDLYVPPYIQIDLEDEKRKIASLKRQISRSKPSNTALYYISESLASISQYLSRIDSWINKLSRGTTKRRKWRSHSTIISLSALGIITLSVTVHGVVDGVVDGQR